MFTWFDIEGDEGRREKIRQKEAEAVDGNQYIGNEITPALAMREPELDKAFVLAAIWAARLNIGRPSRWQPREIVPCVSGPPTHERFPAVSSLTEPKAYNRPHRVTKGQV